MQTAPSVTREDVVRVLLRDFPGFDTTELQTILDGYGVAPWQRERYRVQLAILKLASGKADQIRYHTETAKRDYRDVLAAAEYPGYASKTTGVNQLPPEEAQRVIEADWKQYQDWLGR